MNFWTFLDKVLERLPGWPIERQVVMILTYGMGMTMLIMARSDPTLWTVELFKTLITVVIVTGIVNMILSFHYAANKIDETKSQNTALALSGMSTMANAVVAAAASSPADVGQAGEITKAAEAVAGAAQDKADEIRGTSEPVDGTA